jgi:hypothetical protein
VAYGQRSPATSPAQYRAWPTGDGLALQREGASPALTTFECLEV